MNFNQLASLFKLAKPTFWTKSGEGDGTLHVALPQEIDLKKRTILILPGIDHVGAGSTKRNYFGLIGGMIGGDLEVEQCMPMYSMTYRNLLENSYDLKRFNYSPETYCGYLARGQARALFNPILQDKTFDEVQARFRNLTIFASSYGAVVARQMANELDHLLGAAGYDEKQRDTLLREIHVLAVCDVGRENEKRGFTTVSFRGLNDRHIQKQVPEYTAQPSQQTLIVATPDRRITTVYCANPEDVTIRRSTGEPIYSPNNHTTPYYAAKKVDAEQNVVPALIENTLLHIVQRNEPLRDPMLFKMPAPPLSFLRKNESQADYAARRAALMAFPVLEGNLPRPGMPLHAEKIKKATSSEVLPQSGTLVPGSGMHSGADRNACGSDWKDRSQRSPAPRQGTR